MRLAGWPGDCTGPVVSETCRDGLAGQYADGCLAALPVDDGQRFRPGDRGESTGGDSGADSGAAHIPLEQGAELAGNEPQGQPADCGNAKENGMLPQRATSPSGGHGSRTRNRLPGN